MEISRFFELVKAVESDLSFRAIEELRQALKNQRDISKIVDPVTKNTLLHEASLQNKAQAVRVILSLPSVDEFFIQKLNKENATALGISKHNGNIDIANLLNTSILRDRAKQFATKLLEEYEAEIDKHRKRAHGENVPDNHHSNFTRGRRLVETFSKCFGVGGIASGVTGAAVEVKQLVYLRKSEKIWRAHKKFYRHHQGNELPKRLTQHLIQDAVEIFSSFEQQMLKFSSKDWDKDCDKLVSDCVKRMIKSVEAGFKDYDNSVHLDEDGSFTKCFMLTRSRDHWKVVERAGVILKKPKGGFTCYEKLDGTSNVEKYGLRKVFEFEKQEGFPTKDYIPVHVPNIHSSEFLLEEKVVRKIIQQLIKTRNIPTGIQSHDDEDDDFGLNIPAPVLPGTGLPFQFGMVNPVESFVGRKEELQTIWEYWNSGIVEDDTVGWLLVTQSQFNQAGCCGIGKAELVRKFANQLSTEQQPNVVFINARNLDNEFGRLYSKLLEQGETDGVPQAEVPIPYLARLCYKSLNRHKPTLFVLLNVGCFKQIQDYLPSQTLSNIRVVITTRTPYSEWGNFDGRKLGKIELRALSEEECEKLMQSIGTHKNLDIKRLAKVLDYSPLALQQVKHHVLNQQQLQPEEPKGKIAAQVVSGYIDSLFWNDVEFTKDAIAIYQMEVNGKNLFKSWDEVFDYIRSTDGVGRIAVEIVEFMAYMLSLPVFLKAFMKPRYSDEKVFNEAIRLLKSYNILIEGGSNGMWTISKLVKKMVRYQSHVELGVEGQTLGRLMQHWQNLLTGNDKVQLSGDYIRHIVFAWSYAKHYNELVETFIIKEDYSQPSNYFLHILLKHDEYQSLEKLLPLISYKLENDSQRKLKIAKAKFSPDGKTPLHLAAARQETVVRKIAFKTFLKWGGPEAIKAADWEGNTPFHDAAQCGHNDVLKIMLEVDKSVINIRNENGESPFDLAKKAKLSESVWLILQYGSAHTNKPETDLKELNEESIVGTFSSSRERV